MKRIINGKRYDTDRARKVAVWDNKQYGSFDYICEELYRKQTGEFFIYGEGGARTQYAKESGPNNWTDGERIMPLTLAEAQEWAEEHLDGDKYEEIFGEIKDDSEKRVVGFQLTEATIKRIAEYAAENGISKSEVIERLVNRTKAPFVADLK